MQGKMILHYGDLIDGNCLVKIINETKPTEIYNLGAQSHVKVITVTLLRSVILWFHMHLYFHMENCMMIMAYLVV